MRALTRWVVLSLMVVTGWSFGQPGPEKPPPDKSLEALIARGLHNNPDVLAAESKLREAEAELRRTKLVLALKITEQRVAVENQRAIVDSAQAEFEMYRDLHKRGVGSESDKRTAEQKMLLAKAQLASAEAALNTTAGVLPKGIAVMAGSNLGGAGITTSVPALGGSISGVAGAPNGGIGSISGAIGGIPGGISGIGGGLVGNLGALGAAGGFAPPSPPARVPSSPMADKLHTALSATVKVAAIKDKPLAEVINSVRPAANVPFLLQLGDKGKQPISLSLDGDVQLGAVFQALEDVVPDLRCYVREYGILVTMDNSIEGAMPLIDFWQDRPGGR